MGHLGLDRCARACEGTARKMRREPGRVGPARTPASPGAGPLPSRGKGSLQPPARPFLALLLLVSVKQVRAVFIIIIVIIISCTCFLITEAIQASRRQFGKYNTVLRQ